MRFRLEDDATPEIRLTSDYQTKSSAMMTASLETRLPGLYPAFLTPLTPDGKVSEPAVEQLIEHLLRAGMDGAYVGGSTGEGMLMDLRQREILVDSLARSMPGTKQ